jgi:hypothetical protein
MQTDILVHPSLPSLAHANSQQQLVLRPAEGTKAQGTGIKEPTFLVSLCPWDPGGIPGLLTWG